MDQLHFADQFAQAEPLKLKTPREGFEHCRACHGSGAQYGPHRCCDECRGMGQVLLDEQRQAARRLQEIVDANARSFEVRDYGRRREAMLKHTRRAG